MKSKERRKMISKSVDGKYENAKQDRNRRIQQLVRRNNTVLVIPVSLHELSQKMNNFRLA